MSSLKSPKTPKTPKTSDGLMGLSMNEVRLLLLGFLCEEVAGKIDFQLLGDKANLTHSSARTMYPKAKKKLIQLNGGAASGANNTPTPTPKKAATKKAPRRPVKKRKYEDTEAEDQAEAEGDDPFILPEDYQAAFDAEDGDTEVASEKETEKISEV